jgi:hypothetical protein
VLDAWLDSPNKSFFDQKPGIKRFFETRPVTKTGRVCLEGWAVLLEPAQLGLRRFDIVRKAEETKPDGSKAAVINRPVCREPTPRVNVARGVRKLKFRLRQNVDL